MARNNQRIESNNGDPELAGIEDGYAGFARIVQCFMEGFGIAAGLFHADCRSDVRFGETGFDRGLILPARLGEEGRCSKCQKGSAREQHVCIVTLPASPFSF